MEGKVSEVGRVWSGCDMERWACVEGSGTQSASWRVWPNLPRAWHTAGAQHVLLREDVLCTGCSV